MMELCRIDAARNMRRFYRLDIERDLFGGFLLLKQWGRIGARGRVIAERFDSEAPALAALQRQASRKKRRGYECVCLADREQSRKSPRPGEPWFGPRIVV